MTNGEMYDTSVGAYQSLGTTILKLTALPTLFCVAAFSFVTGYIFPLLFSTESETNIGAQLLEVVLAIALAFAVGGPLLLIGASLAGAIITSLVSDYMIGNVPSVEAATRTARRLLPKMFLLALRALLVSSVGFLLSIVILMVSALIAEQGGSTDDLSGLIAGVGILGLWVGIILFPIFLSRYALSIPVLVLEGTGVKAAVQRSAQLLRSSPYFSSAYNTVLGLCFLVFLLWLLMWGGLSGIFSMLDVSAWLRNATTGTAWYDLARMAMDVLPWFMSMWIVIPIWCTTCTILYYERRTRLEGYDIEALAQDVWRADKQSRFEL